MQNPSSPPSKNDSLFFYLSLLTFFLLLLEVSFFIQCNKAYLGDFTFVSHKIQIPWRIFPGIAYFVTAQLFLHACFLVGVWLLATASAFALRLSGEGRAKLGLLTFAVGVLFILTANQVYFPNSRFVELTSLALINPTLTEMVLTTCAVILSFQAVVAVAGLMRWLGVYRSVGLAMLSLLLTVFVLSSKPVKPAHPFISTQPNIILVGVDSLRPDFLGYFGSDLATPFIDEFLNASSVFTDSITPIARTFPSWTGILTGLYPKHVNVRTNLSNQAAAHLENALPHVLKQAGYHTVFATDETRFSNLSTAYGFDDIVTPPIGLNDFLLGTFNDFPLSNLVVNTRLGKWLFPYSYGNRPAYITYDPDSFLNLLKPTLQSQQAHPLFLTVHFCLPHSPYLWSKLSGYEVTDARLRYAASINRVDVQLRDLFAQLQTAGLLNHAIVVLLSDHGEALELPGDRVTEAGLFMKPPHTKIPRFYPPSMMKETVNQSAGHGTDILGLPQYHNVFALQLYGLGKQKIGDQTGEVSTLDIMPTVLSLAGISSPKLDGINLAPVIVGKSKAVPNTPIFVESDYSPQAIRTVYPESRNVMLEGIHLFSIDPTTTRLTVRPNMVNMIIHSKQVGIVQNHWMLALYPQIKASRMPILINLHNGEWTNDLHSRFATHSPASGMMKQLTKFYGDEIH